MDAFNEYSRMIRPEDAVLKKYVNAGRENEVDNMTAETLPLSELLEHVNGVEVIVSDDIYRSALKRREHLRTDSYGYSEDIRQLGLLESFNAADAVTHIGKDRAFMFLRPALTAGTVAHEALHVLEESKFPHRGQEAWSYPLGFLTDAALAVQTEAEAKVTFNRTISLATSAADAQQMYHQAVTHDIEALREADPEAGEKANAEFEERVDMSKLMRLFDSLR